MAQKPVSSSKKKNKPVLVDLGGFKRSKKVQLTPGRSKKIPQPKQIQTELSRPEYPGRSK